VNKLAVPVLALVFLTAAASGTESSVDPLWSHVKLVAESVKEILLGIGILVGGGWAVYQYIYMSSHSAQRRAKLRESPPHINITINHNLFKRDDGSYDLVGEVVMEHTGTGELFCDLKNTPPITICRLTRSDEGEFDTLEECTYPRIMSTEKFLHGTMQPNGMWSLKFVEKVEGKQVYLIEFKSRIAEKLAKKTNPTTGTDPNPDVPLTIFNNWISTKIVHVGFLVVKNEEEEVSKKEVQKKNQK